MTIVPPFALQDRKSARVKLRVLETVVQLMGEAPFHTFSVERICGEAEISRATFFNYFGRKEGVLYYYAMIQWLSFTVDQLQRPKRGLAAVYGIFARIAERFQAEPGGLLGFIEFSCRTELSPEWRRHIIVSPAEKVMLYPDVDGIEAVQIVPLRKQLYSHLKQAAADGELSHDFSPGEGVSMLGALMYGMPIMAHLDRSTNLERLFEKGLNRLFGKSVGVTHGG